MIKPNYTWVIGGMKITRTSPWTLLFDGVDEYGLDFETDDIDAVFEMVGVIVRRLGIEFEVIEETE